MSTPSQLGSIGNRVSLVLPLSTSTARFFVRVSDTGTIVSTSRAVDLSFALHVGATGGKPLDATVHARKSGPPVWKSVACAIPLELVYHTSGVNTYVTVAHKTRAATSGAGSTWRTLKTDLFRFKMGTDTDATFHKGIVSDCNLQSVDRFYKTNITTAWRTASSTSTKDTSTNQEMVINSPVWLFSGADSPQVAVPNKVS
jgi:hypothetical protein